MHYNPDQGIVVRADTSDLFLEKFYFVTVTAIYYALLHTFLKGIIPLNEIMRFMIKSFMAISCLCF